MALVVFDRVQETTTTTGTGTLTLAGAVSGFQSFAVVGNGNTCYYAIVDGSAWEVGIGTYTSSGTTLARTTILANSNGTTSAITLAAGSKPVFLTYPAGRSVTSDISNTFTANQIVSVTDNTNAALRVTQLGTGNALLVEDSANPDSTPFAITATGTVLVGYTSALSVEDYVGVSRTPTIQAQGLGGSLSAAYLGSWSNSDTQPSQLIFGKSKSGTVGTNGVVASGTDIGAVVFSADDGTALIPAASILAEVDGTPGTNDMPGRLVFSTTAAGASTPTARLTIYSDGSIQAGSSQSTPYNFRVGRNISGATSGGNFYASGTVQSDVTNNGYGFLSEIKTAAASFVLSAAHGFRATQGTIGAGSSITNQYGFNADSTLVGATNNYGFYSNIPAGTGDWNFYANGTAQNYFGGATTFNAAIGLGSAASPSYGTSGQVLTSAGTGAVPTWTTPTTGTVTSVGGTGTVSGLTLTGTVTTTGNLTLGGTLAVTASNFASQTANTFLAAPNGAAGVPTFRAMVAADVPTLNQDTTGNAATATALSTASGSAPSYSARAWVKFNGTGTVAILGSGNVTGITDVGTGLYTVNFTTAMPDANYAAVAATGQTGTTAATQQQPSVYTYTTSAVSISSVQGSTRAFSDSSEVSVVVFR